MGALCVCRFMYLGTHIFVYVRVQIYVHVCVVCACSCVFGCTYLCVCVRGGDVLGEHCMCECVCVRVCLSVSMCIGYRVLLIKN